MIHHQAINKTYKLHPDISIHCATYWTYTEISLYTAMLTIVIRFSFWNNSGIFYISVNIARSIKMSI